MFIDGRASFGHNILDVVHVFKMNDGLQEGNGVGRVAEAGEGGLVSGTNW